MYNHINQLTLDNYFSKIFYINLERDTARDARMLKQFYRFGITNYERIDAIQLTELPQEAYYRNFNKRAIKYLLGSLSCRASHLKCFSLAKERGYENVLILEDDIVFLQDPNWLLQQNAATLNEWDMLYFGGDIEAFFRNQVVRAHAFAVKNTLFADILNMADASGMEIDNFYAKIIQHMSYNYNRSGKYDIRIIQPFNMVIQDDYFPSNIQPG